MHDRLCALLKPSTVLTLDAVQSRNVCICIYFLLGNCKLGGVACLYSHDSTYRSIAGGKTRKSTPIYVKFLTVWIPAKVPLSWDICSKQRTIAFRRTP
ncbi:hypothetical protein BC827DRAFT_1215080 [Russula dissimulans]|nr:hypothetical protein BC827DRAFT_1215080 [Russula dissimulans]